MIRCALALAMLGVVFGAMMARSRMELRAMQASKAPRQGETQPVELGRVQWNRVLDKGKHAAAASGKPLLVLFQEVPG